MTRKSFTDFLREERRLVILRILSEMHDYKTNSSRVYAALDYLGVTATRDDVSTELAWLQEQGLIALENVAEVKGLSVATITQRGLDVVLGKAIVPGVMKPGPR